MDRFDYQQPGGGDQQSFEWTLGCFSVFFIGLLIFLWTSGAFSNQNSVELKLTKLQYETVKKAIEDLNERKDILIKDTDSLEIYIQKLDSLSKNKQKQLEIVKSFVDKKPTDYLIDIGCGLIVSFLAWFILPPRRRKSA